MKNKLLVLSLGALCVSQIWESNRASAVVSGEENPYVSESLKLNDNKSKSLSLEKYKESLRSIMCTSEINKNDGYDEPEYKEAMDTYRKKLFAELDALNKFLDEERKIASYIKKNMEVPSNILGLTHGRYTAIYNAIKENKKEFEKNVENIESKHLDLKRFDEDKDYEARVKLNELENKVLMLGQAFPDKVDARESLYNKLDMIVGLSNDEIEERHPQNERLLKERVEDLETIIDEFFNDIGENRPENISPLTNNEHKNKEMITKLKADTEEAKTNTAKRSKRSLNTHNHKSTSQEVSEQQKAEYEKRSEERKARFLDKQKNKKTPVVSLIDDEDDNENDKQLVVSAPSKKPTSPTTYTETTTQVPMPTVERQTQQQIIYNAPKQLAGLNGESHDFTTTHQSPTTSNHTHSNLIEFEETSALPGRKSGSLVGISQIDSSHLTEREKRVIKREHVREAQKLVDNYKDTHSYKDRLNAQQKVNTLSEGHQKRFNKQINKVYNGK